jgi:hypothetical protein
MMVCCINYKLGYTGPFCGVCDDKYYYDSFNRVCLKCEHTDVNIFGIVTIELMSLIAVAFLVYYTWDTIVYFLGFKIRTGNLSSKFRSTREVASRVTNIQNKLKLLASTFQILTQDCQVF